MVVTVGYFEFVACATSSMHPYPGVGDQRLASRPADARPRSPALAGVRELDRLGRKRRLWVSKMSSESFMPEVRQIDEFNIDSAFVNSDNNASHSLGQTNPPKIRPSFRYEPFGLFRRINLIVPSRFLRLDLLSICIREHLNRVVFKLPADTGDAVHRLRGLR